MNVELFAYTPDPETLCAKCASVSWRKKAPKGNMTLEKAREILRRVMSYGHISVIEHANFTFFVEGISRSLTHQLVRHRIASYTQQSMRYVNLTGEEEYFIKPKSIENMDVANTVFDIIIFLCKWAYNFLIKSGIKPEDARFVLPIASQTKIAITMNARELIHFFSLRCCERAQWEIRSLATEMFKLVKKVAPSIFEKAGPSCVRFGRCPEGKLCCGKMKEVIERFKNY